MTPNTTIVAAGLIGLIIGVITGLAVSYFAIYEDMEHQCRKCRSRMEAEKRVMNIGLRDRD